MLFKYSHFIKFNTSLDIWLNLTNCKSLLVISISKDSIHTNALFGITDLVYWTYSNFVTYGNGSFFYRKSNLTGSWVNSHYMSNPNHCAVTTDNFYDLLLSLNRMVMLVELTIVRIRVLVLCMLFLKSFPL